jgi:hypothetical protein
MSSSLDPKSFIWDIIEINPRHTEKKYRSGDGTEEVTVYT